jgi:probable HAF family extracellular repeat protein
MKQLPAIAQTFILTSFSVLSLLAAPAQAASFRGLGFLDSDNQYRSSEANGVSADGSVVVGRSSNSNGSEAFRWTQETGMVGLGFLDSNDQYSDAQGVSADGSILVGSSFKVNGYGEAFRWTQESGMVGLGFLPGYNPNSFATGVSADGSVVVGGSNNVNRIEAFRWTQAEGMFSLGSLADDDFLITAYGVSADGSIVVGDSVRSGISSDGLQEAFRWTQSVGMVGLDSLPGGASSSRASAVSADGSVIVGSSASVNGYEASLWTQSDGMIALGSYGSYGNAEGVSANGSVVVGYSSDSNQSGVFRWTQQTGMVSLKETLIGEGLDLSGWSLTSANAISADGFTIVGNGINPSGQNEAWVANLSPEAVPEPLTILGAMTAAAFGTAFKRQLGQNQSEEKDPDA